MSTHPSHSERIDAVDAQRQRLLAGGFSERLRHRLAGSAIGAC